MDKIELIDLLKKEKYLTSDNFQTPDRTYIFLDNDEQIKFVGIGNIIYNFNLEIYKEAKFRKINKKYKIFVD